MGDELRGLEDAKSEALAAFAAIAAIIDLANNSEAVEHGEAISSLRAAAVGHLSAAMDIIRMVKGSAA